MKRLTKNRPLTEYEATNLSLTDLYMRLKAYEDTGLEPEEVSRQKDPLTNADRIRQMTDEELAHVLRCLPEQTPPDEGNCNTYNCYLCTISWLKQEG